jgi:hypothetical protein
MKTLTATLLIFSTLTTGCVTEKVTTPFDLAAPLMVTVYANGRELIPNKENERTLNQMLKFWLPQMKNTFTTYPTPQYRLQVSGKTKEGKDYTNVVFVGSNWIGDGHGITTLADTQAFKLHRTIEAIIANVSVDLSPASSR